MVYSIITKQSGAMMCDQFQQLLSTMTAGLNPVKLAVTFAMSPGKVSILKGVD